MAVDRRTILKGIAAAPAAAAAASLPAAQAAAINAETAAAPLDWGWYAGTDGERFGLGPFETKSELITEAKAVFGNWFHVLEAVPGKYTTRVFEGGRGLEVLSEVNSEYSDPDGDEPFVDVSNEASDDLDRMLDEVVAVWVKKHNIPMQAWMFGRSRNAEYVEYTPPAKPERCDSAEDAANG